MDAIKMEAEVDQLATQTNHNANIVERSISEKDNLLDLQLNGIKEECLDLSYDIESGTSVLGNFPVIKCENEEGNLIHLYESGINAECCDLTSEIKVEETSVSTSFPVMKYEVQEESCVVNTLNEELMLKVMSLADEEVLTGRYRSGDRRMTTSSSSYILINNEQSITKRRCKSSGIEQQEWKRLKTNRKSCCTRERIVLAKSPASAERFCHCRYHCGELSENSKLELFENFDMGNCENQGTYLMGLIHLGPVRRRRNGNYNDPSESRRQSTVSYNVPNEKGELIQVCKNTFMNIFAVTKKRIETIIRKKKMGHITFKDERKSHKKAKFTDDDRKRVRQHINSILRDESHFRKTKASKNLVNTSLNVHQLCMAFNEKFKDSLVSYKFYRRVFREEFPNLRS
ncbi:uncharacterized protein [Periplaneta americana]|uniref:uncharacterized protein n=1 Tax=Periplaneta americana TaxID=6978 RepID=UPI0037E7CF2C